MIWKVVKRIDPRVLISRRKNNFFPFFFIICELMDVNKTCCGNHFYILVKQYMKHTWNLNSDVCQSYLKKIEEWFKIKHMHTHKWVELTYSDCQRFLWENSTAVDPNMIYYKNPSLFLYLYMCNLHTNPVSELCNVEMQSLLFFGFFIVVVLCFCVTKHKDYLKYTL